MSYEVFDDDINCPNCGGRVEIHYVHWAEVKDYCKKCDLYFIYNKGDPYNTIEFVDKDHYKSQENADTIRISFSYNGKTYKSFTEIIKEKNREDLVEAGNSTEEERGLY